MYLYTIIRKDLMLNEQQAATQLGHAYKTPLYIATRDFPALADEYMGESYGSNITLETKKLKHLLDAFQGAKAMGIPCALISEDLYPEPGTRIITALGFGPIRKSQARELTKRFQLFKGTN